MPWTRRAVTAGLAATAAAPVSAAAPAAASRPIVIAHRGASGERPEHTLSAYRLAIEAGADFIEPDLVVSRDGVLICRHETEIGATTDVAARPAFADRRTRKSVDGQPVEGWFAEDFTLAELKTLRCRERIPALRPANAAFDGQDQIVTLQELIDLARPAGVGLYCELKHPTDLAAAGHDTLALLAHALKRNGLDRRDAPVIAECFEVGAVRRLREAVDVRLTQLIAAEGAPPDRPTGPSHAEMISPAGLRQIAGYADGIGPEKRLVLPRSADGGSLAPTRLCADAHDAGLFVHAWTFRAENAFLPDELRRGEAPGGRGDLETECELGFAAGLDGLFCDQPAQAVAARNRFAAARL